MINPALCEEGIKDKFGPTEVTFPVIGTQEEGRTLNRGAEAELMRAVDVCLQADSHQLFFGSWEQKLMALLPAYCLLLIVTNVDDKGMSALFRHPYIASLKRSPSKKNPALLAVRLITKPEWPHDHKVASDYAAMLLHAQLLGVVPEDFLQWASGRTLRECRKAVSTARRASSPQSKEPEYEVTRPTRDGQGTAGDHHAGEAEFVLTITSHSSGDQTEHSVRFEGVGGRVHLRAPESNDVALPVLLRWLADALAHSKFGVYGSDNA
ncbi:hypothetical protein X747_12640 [Mesorhizobium sp. LNJC384A00]|nr:hypothetical protein X747_12640 [Mesorhizobium sp. LNJC384A00]